MNNTPSSELPSAARAHRRKYICQVLDVGNNSTLTTHSDIANQLINLTMTFWNVFYREGNCGGTKVIEHLVYTPKGLPPIRLKNRPVNPGLTNSLKEQIATWHFFFASFAQAEFPPGIFLSCPSGRRMANGDGLLTSASSILLRVRTHSPFPTSLSYLRKSKYFTSLDLAQAFHSIPVREVDREKLSFCALDKFYQFCQMPFGLTSAPNTWARLVTQVMQDIPKSKLIVFFDDLLIHSPDLATHMGTLKQVFMLLRRAGLRLNMEKTDWVKTEVKFLGHLISDQGVTVPFEFS